MERKSYGEHFKKRGLKESLCIAANTAAGYAYSVDTKFINLSQGQETNCQLIDYNNTQIDLCKRNNKCGRKKCRIIEFKVKPQDRMKVCEWASLSSKCVTKECVSAKRTWKHQALSTTNNLKIKRSFELSCGEGTKKQLKMIGPGLYFARETVTICSVLFPFPW